MTNSPATTWTPYGLTGAGDAYAFDGTTNACDGTFSLDLTGVAPATNTLKRYFLGLQDTSTDTATGPVKFVTFIDMVNSNSVTVTPLTNPGSFNPATGTANGTTAWGCADLTFGVATLGVTLPTAATEGDGGKGS